MHFITPHPVLVESNEKQNCCVRCKSVIISDSVMILHQSKISNVSANLHKKYKSGLFTENYNGVGDAGLARLMYLTSVILLFQFSFPLF